MKPIRCQICKKPTSALKKWFDAIMGKTVWACPRCRGELNRQETLDKS